MDASALYPSFDNDGEIDAEGGVIHFHIESPPDVLLDAIAREMDAEDDDARPGGLNRWRR